MRVIPYHLNFEKAFKLIFVNKSLVCIPVWIEQKKLLNLGFGIFEEVREEGVIILSDRF